jgi:hypothetical protein
MSDEQTRIVIRVPGDTPPADGRYLSTPEFAKARGVNLRTVKRWIEKGRIMGAEQDPDTGRWRIPADAAIRLDLARPAPAPAPAPVPVPVPVRPLGSLVTITAAARELGTTRKGVRAMAAAGLVKLGPFGPDPRRDVVWIPPQHHEQHHDRTGQGGRGALTPPRPPSGCPGEDRGAGCWNPPRNPAPRSPGVSPRRGP